MQFHVAAVAREFGVGRRGAVNRDFCELGRESPNGKCLHLSLARATGHSGEEFQVVWSDAEKVLLNGICKVESRALGGRSDANPKLSARHQAQSQKTTAA